MKNMSKKLKATIAAIAACVLLAGIALTLALTIKPRIEVVSVSSMMMTWQPGSAILTGVVDADNSQTVYLDGENKVSEVCVREGDSVTIGTPLIKYDSTLYSINLDLKKLECQKIELRITSAQKELKKLGGKELPYSSALATTSPKTRPLGMEEQPISGSGTTNDPYVFIAVPGDSIDKTLIDRYLGEYSITLQEIYLSFEFREGGLKEGALAYSIMVHISANGFEFTASLPTPTPTAPPTATPTVTPTATPTGDPGVVVPGGMTSEERKARIKELQVEILEARLALKQAELDVKIAERELDSSTVKATVNGVVSFVGDPKSVPAGEVIIEVTGSNGVTITSTINELQRPGISEGSSVNVFSYDTGISYIGTITSIDDLPEENSFYSNGMSPASSYPIAVYVPDADIPAGAYVEMTLLEDNQTDSSIYISGAYIREENGLYYVMKDSDGVLTRQYVTIGRSFYEFKEITSGLTANDYLAFPYDRAAREGARTVLPEEPDPNYGIAYEGEVIAW